MIDFWLDLLTMFAAVVFITIFLTAWSDKR
jgi:hypothetical protein